MSRIKLIWDFRGADAPGLAEHHVKHLEEFARREEFPDGECDCAPVNDKHWMAWIVVPEEKMISVRDALRPHRGQRLE